MCTPVTGWICVLCSGQKYSENWKQCKLTCNHMSRDCNESLMSVFLTAQKLFSFGLIEIKSEQIESTSDDRL